MRYKPEKKDKNSRYFDGRQEVAQFCPADRKIS